MVPGDVPLPVADVVRTLRLGKPRVAATHSRLRTPALGDVSGDATDRVDAAVGVAQRELVRGVRVLAVGLEQRFLQARSAAAGQHRQVVGSVHGGILRRKEVNARLADQRVAVNTEDALELPVAEQQTPFAVIRVKHDRGVVQNAQQVLLNLIRRSLRRDDRRRRTATIRRTADAPPCEVVPIRLAGGLHSRSFPTDGTALTGDLARSHAAREYRAVASTACP